MNILITGASSGLGLSIARRFVQEGHRVIAVGRREERLIALKEELGKERIHPLTLDIRNRDQVNALFGTLPKPFSEIDVLVNNAGLALGLEPAQEADPVQWDTMVDTNIKGVLNATQALLPGMVRRNLGHIINMGSIAANYAYPGGNVYGASKAFIRQFSLNLRTDLLGTRVRVTVIEPGLVGGTEFSSIRLNGDKERVNKIYEGADALTPEDIAETVFWVSALPSRVNINAIELMPVTQAPAALAVYRNGSV